LKRNVMPRPTLSVTRQSPVDDVAALHQALGENGFPCESTPELTFQFFGSGTEEAVKLFQACNVGPDGQPLVPDGVVGPKTWWALEDCGGESLPSGALLDMPVQEPSNPVAEAALRSAWEELRLGVRESPNGSNRGPRVDLYTGFSGHPPTANGPPWCAYFASWNFAKAPGGSPFGRIGGARVIVDHCQRFHTGSVVDAFYPLVSTLAEPYYYQVRPGDLGVIPTGPGHGHVFHVAAALDGLLWTVEGNSGNAVRTRKRLASSARWFVNFDRYARARHL
jgi:hypothetical protein